MTDTAKNKKIPFVFFGTPEFAVTILNELKAENLLPSHIVTAPDTPQGRGMKLTPPPVKVWAETNNVPILQPKTLNDAFCRELSAVGCELFVVAAYGKLLPKTLVDMPGRDILNVHPSLLPKYRGPSPIEAQILNDDRETGVTIMHIDEKMDHGPLLAQTQVTIEREDWPVGARELETILAEEGGKLLAYILPRWVAGEVDATPQTHDRATYCTLIQKQDAEINLDDNPRTNFLKIKAYEKWPVAYFFAEQDGKRVRVKITDADYRDGELIINRVIPEGKKEIQYSDFRCTL